MVETDRQKERLNVGQRIIIFIGAEGSGKSTIAKRLAVEVDKPYITTGDIIRDLAANDPGELGDECREMFANHAYLAGETLLRILIERFAREDAASGFVLDGGLRTLKETREFGEMLLVAGHSLPVTVFYLQIPDEVSFERLKARARADDTPEAIASRLAKFHDQLEERLEIIAGENNWELVEVNGRPAHDDVYAEVLDALD